MYIKVLSSLWNIFGSSSLSSTDDDFKSYIFDELLKPLEQGFYKVKKYEKCAIDLTLFLQIVTCQTHIWKTLQKPAIKCAEEIILQFSASKPETVAVLEEVGQTTGLKFKIMAIGQILLEILFY